MTTLKGYPKKYNVEDSGFRRGFNQAVDLFTKVIIERSDTDRIVRTMDSAFGYYGIGTKLTIEEIDILAKAISNLFREGK